MEDPERSQGCTTTSPEAREGGYGDYLRLDRLLSAQSPRSPRHDELLFIIQHQTSELWMKLMIHELLAAIDQLHADRFGPCLKTLTRVSQIQRQLFEQWAVLETMTPSEHLTFREALGPASGLQSHQFRALEYLLGNKSDRLDLRRYDPSGHELLRRLYGAPSLYDELLRALARRGLPVPDERLERDWTQPYAPSPAVVQVFRQIYQVPDAHWAAYVLCEKLVDLEGSFQLWRFRHVKAVERVIGFKPGTGGTTGVAFLRRRLELSFYPELIDVRSHLH